MKLIAVFAVGILAGSQLGFAQSSGDRSIASQVSNTGRPLDQLGAGSGAPTSMISQVSEARPGAPIRFEDATAKAGIDFTHSFGSRQLGSLLEGTGAGCVWFDYNHDGLPDLYVANGRPLED